MTDLRHLRHLQRLVDRLACRVHDIFEYNDIEAEDVFDDFETIRDMLDDMEDLDDLRDALDAVTAEELHHQKTDTETSYD